MSSRGNLYNAERAAYAVKPKNVNGQHTLRTKLYRDRIINLLAGCITISADDGLLYDADYVKDCLLRGGAIGILDTAEYGKVLYAPSPLGQNIFRRPNAAMYTFASSDGVTAERTIGTDTEIIYLLGSSYSAHGVMDDVNCRAERLASIDASIDVNLINSRSPIAVSVADGKQKATAEVMMDKAYRGEPAVFIRSGVDGSKGVELSPLFEDTNLFVDKLQQIKRTEINDLLTRYGINNANTDKRERLNTDEVNANDEELYYNVEQIRQSLKRGCDAANKMFDVGLSITWGGWHGDSAGHGTDIRGDQDDGQSASDL